MDRTCSLCRRTFTKPAHLQRHLLTHAQEKPFTCEHCSRAFARTDALNRHVRTVHAKRSRDEKDTDAEQAVEALFTLNETPAPEIQASFDEASVIKLAETDPGLSLSGSSETASQTSWNSLMTPSPIHSSSDLPIPQWPSGAPLQPPSLDMSLGLGLDDLLGTWMEPGGASTDTLALMLSEYTFVGELSQNSNGFLENLETVYRPDSENHQSDIPSNMSFGAASSPDKPSWRATLPMRSRESLSAPATFVDPSQYTTTTATTMRQCLNADTWESGCKDNPLLGSLEEGETEGYQKRRDNLSKERITEKIAQTLHIRPDVSTYTCSIHLFFKTEIEPEGRPNNQSSGHSYLALSRRLLASILSGVSSRFPYTSRSDLSSDPHFPSCFTKHVQYRVHVYGNSGGQKTGFMAMGARTPCYCLDGQQYFFL